MERRAFLSATSVCMASFAGCVTNSDPSREEVEYETKPFATMLTVPDWRQTASKSGDIHLFGSGQAVIDTLEFGEIEERRYDAIIDFIDTTDFRTDRILYISSVGPRPAFNDIEVIDLATKGQMLVGEARAKEDESAPAGSITFPSTLVRISSPDPVLEAELTVIDGWEEQTEAASGIIR